MLDRVLQASQVVGLVILGGIIGGCVVLLFQKFGHRFLR